jgi:transposase
MYTEVMRTKDTRRMSPEAQEEIRYRVVAAVRDGMRKSEAARRFQVSRPSIDNWLKRVESGNIRSLKSKKRGPKAGSRLRGHQAALVVRTVTDHCPDQLKMPFVLWTREAVRTFIEKRFGIQVSVWTVGRYLKRWGLTPQKPLRRAYERNPAKVEHWLTEEYPAIARRAKAEKAEIHWGDQMGVRSDHHAGRSYGRRGQTPVVPATGKRFGCNMMSTITNRGTLRFMIFKKRFNTSVMIDFLSRLVRSVGHKVYLILDNHPVHRARRVKHWLSEHVSQLELFFLPDYSPELNPDELLNQDVKTNAVGRRNAATPHELESNLRSYLRSTQKRPDIVRNYFQEQHVAYAAAQ